MRRVGRGRNQARASRKLVRAKSLRRGARAEAAEAQVLLAARRLLRKIPFRKLAIDQLMAQTNLSRPAFYVYFRDRYELLMRLVEKLAEEVFPMVARWSEGKNDPLIDLRATCEGVAEVCLRHGYLFRALGEASPGDARVERIYRGLMERLVLATTERMKADVALGRIRLDDPEEVARALCMMGERYFLEKLGRGRPADPARVVNTMVTIWGRTLYGSSG